MDAPEAPDTGQTLAEQQSADLFSAQVGNALNNYNQKGPTGSVKYKNTGGFTTVYDAEGNKIKIPRQKQVTKLSPEEQAIFDTNQKLRGNLSNLAVSQVDKLGGILEQTPIDFANAPTIPKPSLISGYKGMEDYITPGIDLRWQFGKNRGDIQTDVGPDDWGAQRQEVIDSLMSMYDEQEADNIQRLDARLAAQGINPADEAARAEFYDLDKARNDATMRAILAGGQEQSRLAGLELAQGAFRNQAQQQDFSQRGQMADFHNRAVAQMFDQARMLSGDAGARAGFSNNVAMANYGIDTDTYNRWVAEQMAPSNQVINQVTALMGLGAPLQAPQAYQPYQYDFRSPDVMGFNADIFGTEAQMYGDQMAAWSSMFGNLIPW